MKLNFIFAMLLAFTICVGCQNSSVSETGNTESGATTKVDNQTVEASCGECQFGMEGSSCDLAVRIDGKTYFVDGSKMDEHGDAHGPDGMCNCVRHAKVTGEIKGDRFVATSFEVLPQDKSDEASTDEHSKDGDTSTEKHDHDDDEKSEGDK